jgi:hypothetical protein
MSNFWRTKQDSSRQTPRFRTLSPYAAVERAIGERPTAALGQPVAKLVLLDESFKHQLVHGPVDPTGQRPAEVRARQADSIRQLAERLVRKGAQGAQHLVVKG